MVTLQTRRFRVLLLYAVCLLPAVLWGAHVALTGNKNSPFQWVPPTFAPRADYEDFCRSFGSGEALIVTWPGCKVDSPDLELLAHTLRRGDLFRSGDGQPYIEHVVTGQDALRGLMAEPLMLSRADALARIRGTLVGPDGQTTCAVVTMTPAGLTHRAEVVEKIRSGLARYCHAPIAEQHFAGPVMDGLTVDQASDQSVNGFAPLSALIAFLVCWRWLRWLPGALLVLAVSVYCEMATVSLIHWCGGEMSALLVVLPPLIQVVTASGGIHLINYYLIARQSYDAEEAAWGALRIGWIPCTLSATTNAIGLGSLVVSSLSPVRTFGLFGALGVALTLGVVLAFVPGALAIWKPKGISRKASINFDDGSFVGEAPFWTWLSRLVARRHAMIVVGAVLLMAGLGWGLQWVKTSVHLRTLFPSGSRILADYAWIEEHVGPVAPIEVVLGFEKGSGLSDAEQFALVENVQVELRRIQPIRGTVSAANMMPSLPAGLDKNDADYKQLVGSILKEAGPFFADAHYLHEANSRRQWRVTAYVSALDDVDFGRTLATIRERLANVGAADRPDLGVTLRVTGAMPLVHEIQRALMQDLTLSFFSAFIIIAVVMSVAQAGLLTGLISMIPNFFPMVVMFGLLGWLGFSLDIGSVMTASIALGIAIDDVLHFLTFYRRALARGLPRQEAVHTTYQQCGYAMLLSSAVCGLAPMAFYFSSFLPASRFAWMMLLLLSIAVLGDLVLLPALVVGPAGRLFARQYARPMRSPEVDEEERTDKDRADDDVETSSTLLLTPRRRMAA